MRVTGGPKAAREHAARLRGVCRGEGVGYLVFGSREALCAPEAVATLRDGTPVVCSCHVVGSAARAELAPRDAWACLVVVPLLRRDVVVLLSERGRVVARSAFPALASKLSSRLLTQMRPHAADLMRGYERRHGSGRAEVDLAEVWPGEDGEVVWRVRAILPEADEDATVGLEVRDADGRVVPCDPIVMEDHVVPAERDRARMVRLVTLSCTLPESLRQFHVVAFQDGACVGFAGMNPARRDGMLADVRRRTGGAEHDGGYGSWFERHRATEAELALQRQAAEATGADGAPLVSLVIPVLRGDRADSLRDTLDSVLAQSYPWWEVVVAGDALPACDDGRVRLWHTRAASRSACACAGIRSARGAYVGVLGCGDALEPDALWTMANAAGEHGMPDALYSDEDECELGRLVRPRFKTFPNYGRLYAHNYVGDLLLLRRDMLDRMPLSAEDDDAAFRYDLVLRTFERAQEVLHVPKVLYHAHATEAAGPSASHEACRRVLARHLARRGIAAQVCDGPLPDTFRVRYELPEPAARASVVIPTRDHADLLRTCVESILRRTDYPDFEVVLVENGSQDPKTFRLYDELLVDPRVRLVTWVPPVPGQFNYSALVNHGAAAGTGEVLVFLNNDTEVISPDWLGQMVGCLMRPEVGVVGAKLLFGDGLIQHVGMAANPSGDFCHVCQNLTSTAPGPYGAAVVPGDYAMVTGACQATWRRVFEELGGYDEGLAVGFNDGDFCLRAREKGYAVTVAADALLHHREFSSRGREVVDSRLRERFLREKGLLMARHAAFLAQGDPSLNPNLDGYSAYFELAR